MPFSATNTSPDSRIQLAALIDALPLGMVMVDRQCQPILTNRQLIRLIRYDSNQTIVQQLNTKFELKKICEESWATATLLPPKEISLDNRFLRLLVNPIIVEGEPAGAVLLVEDITEKKILDRARDEFFAIASHELRTPLTAIRGNSDMILQYFRDAIKDNKDLVSMIEDIHQSSGRLITIVNDFLDASRLEAGRIRFDVQKVDIDQIIEGIIHEFQPAAEAKGLHLHFAQPEHKLPAVLADPVRAKQILTNLIGNGVKFTHEGGVVVSVGEGDGCITVYVADTGPGIPIHNRQLLFRKFQQAGEKILSRDMTQGTGMGLYISKLLAEGMAGCIGLKESEANKGSTFFFTLPLAERG